MNKKILLPFAVAALGVTACNGAKFDVKVASNAAYEAAVATAKDLDSFLIDTNISSSKFDMVYTHHNPDGVKKANNKKQTYTINLSDVSAELYAKFGGLKQCTTIDTSIINTNVKSHIGIYGLTSKGTVTYDCERVQANPLQAILNFDDVGSIEKMSLFINRNDPTASGNKVYGAFFDFGASASGLSKIKYTLNPTYKNFEHNIENRIKNFVDVLTENEKRYASIAELPYIGEEIAEYISEIGFGFVGTMIDAFTKHTDEEKAEAIKTIEETMTEMNKTDAGEILSMGYTDNKLHFDVNLNHEKLNKLSETNVFTSGTVKVTLSADDNKRIGSLNLEVKDLKTNGTLTISDNKEVLLNDVNLKVESTIDYDVIYSAFASVVDDHTGTGFVPFPSEK